MAQVVIGEGGRASRDHRDEGKVGVIIPDTPRKAGDE